MSTPKKPFTPIDEMLEGLSPLFGYFGSHKITSLVLESTPKRPTGRPRKGVQRTRTISFSLDPDTIALLDSMAYYKGVSRSEVIHQLINNSTK